MIVETVKHSGAITVTALVCDGVACGEYYETRTYYGYTKAESVTLFREWCQSKGKQINEEDED